MEVLITADATRAAAVAAGQVLAGLPPDRPPVLGLATGSSPLGLYRELAAAAREGRWDVSEAAGVALDEYVGLPPGHPQSYRSVLEREVCDVVGIGRGRLLVPDGTGADEDALQAAAVAYEVAVAELGGVDVQILGIGANGHLGFNEPGSALDLAHPGEAALRPHARGQCAVLRLRRRRPDALRDSGAGHDPRLAAARPRRGRRREGDGGRRRARGSAVGVRARRRCCSGTPTRSWCSTRLPRRSCATVPTTTPRRQACPAELATSSMPTPPSRVWGRPIVGTRPGEAPVALHRASTRAGAAPRQTSSASLLSTCLMLGLVAAVPSAYSSVGTVWLPPLTLSTNAAASGSLLDVDLGELDALAAHLRLQALAVAAPGRAVHRDRHGGSGSVVVPPGCGSVA